MAWNLSPPGQSLSGLSSSRPVSLSSSRPVSLWSLFLPAGLSLWSLFLPAGLSLVSLSLGVVALQSFGHEQLAQVLGGELLHVLTVVVNLTCWETHTRTHTDTLISSERRMPRVVKTEIKT